MKEWAETAVSWLIVLGIAAVVGFLIWNEYFRPPDLPSYLELQQSVAASATCDDLRAAHFAALDAHEAEGIEEHQMDSLWRDVLDQAEVIQPGASLITHLRCTGLIGTCPRGTPADMCADLQAEDLQP